MQKNAENKILAITTLQFATSFFKTKKKQSMLIYDNIWHFVSG